LAANIPRGPLELPDENGLPPPLLLPFPTCPPPASPLFEGSNDLLLEHAHASQTSGSAAPKANHKRMSISREARDDSGQSTIQAEQAGSTKTARKIPT
jgi:hypothetical protein